MKQKTSARVSMLILSAMLLFLVACGAPLKKMAEIDTYSFGDDHIPSIRRIVGTRQVTGFETKVDGNGDMSQMYQYRSSTISDDLDQYGNYLVGQLNYVVTIGGDLQEESGSIQFATESVDEGKIILFDIEWSAGQYKFTLLKTIGTLTRY
ncbi:MAG: hypothetical protein ACOX2M_01800 [Fastidiosipilaceae bacterium]